MADDQTPPRSGRKIPVPMPVLIGIGVAIVAGIYLMRRNATKQAAQPTTTAQPPVVLAGNGGGGIPAGLLYTLFQNMQSSPAAAGTGSTGTGSSGTGAAPNVVGMTLQQAQQKLQAAGYSVATVEQAGIAGQRFASTLTPQQASAQANQPVVAVQPGTSPNTVTLWTNPS